jgi:uncharacterized ubiquitin-like protein YukD
MKGFIDKIIIVAIILVSTVLIVNNISPLVQQGRDLQRIDDAKKILKIIDSVTNQLSVESTGAKRAININLPDNAKLIFSGAEDKIKIRIANTDIMKTGGRVQEENLVIQGGGTFNAYESDINNDGTADLVLENAAVLFAIQKFGSEDSYTFINTTNFITLIRNRRQSIDMAPKSGIFINEKSDSSYGYGYTKLTATENVQSASILMHINSTANITYDAIFTLSAGMDFVEMEVHNVKGSVS